ncbi:MAG: hypothetical protein H7318_14925 [Oligoflexus sp.]|nr:hypothetical protein [Oligoflexus sp.]
MRYKTIFLLALALASSVGQTKAMAADVELPLTCLQEGFPNSSFQQKGQLLTRDLTLALMTGDLPTMAARFDSITTLLLTCSEHVEAKDKQKADDRYALLCDADCHQTMAQYKLLLAADMPFLSSKLESKLDPKGAQLNAEAGRQIIEKGLSVLAKQYAPQGNKAAEGGPVDSSVMPENAGTASTEDKPSLFNYTFKQARLLETKVRLDMAAGDNWYMSAANQQLIRMSYEIGSALELTGEGASQGKLSASESMVNALAFYRNALWSVVEAKTDIPDQVIYSTLSNDLLTIQKELEDRIASAEKGYLFLNIDPEALNLAKYDVILSGLQGVLRDIKGIEDKIEAIVQEGANQKLSADLKAASSDVSLQQKRESDSRYQTSQELSLSLHKIGKLQEDYQNIAEHTKNKIDALGNDNEISSYRRESNRLKFDLDQQKKEVAYKITQLQGKKDQDMLAYNLESKNDALNEVRWLMNHKITVSNLEIQVLTFTAQIQEYNRNIQRNNDELNGVVEAMTQKTLAITSNDRRKDQIKNEIALLNNNQTDLFKLKRSELRSQICSMETQIHMVSKARVISKPFAPISGEESCPAAPALQGDFNSYRTRICDIRKEMGVETLKAQAYVLVCLLGQALPEVYHDVTVQCPSLESGGAAGMEEFKNKRLLTKQILDNNKASAEQQLANAIKTRDDFDSKVNSWLATVATVKNYVQAADAAANLAAAVYQGVASSSPAIVGVIAGPMGGAITAFNPSAGLASAVQTLKNVADFVSKAADREIAFQSRRGEIEKSLNDMKSIIDKLTHDVTALNLQYQMTFLELGVSEKSEDSKANQLSEQHKLMLLDCDEKEVLEQESKLDTFLAQHDAMVTRLDMLAEENESYAIQILNLQSQDRQQDDQKEIIQSEIRVLKGRQDLIKHDNEEIASLIKNVNDRIENTSALQQKLAADKNLGDSLLEQIQKLKSDRLTKALDLTDKEAVFVQTQLDDKTPNVDETRASLEKSMDNAHLQQDMRNELLGTYDSIQTEIGTERTKVLDLSKQTAADGGITPVDNSQEIFEVSRDQVFGLVRGLPDYIMSKKRKLNLANQLAFMAQKKRAVFSKLGGVPSADEYHYLRSYEALAKYTGPAEGGENGTLFTLQDQQILVGYARIDIPGDSAFAQAMARNGEVVFQVTPAAKGDMQSSGYLSVWPKDVDSLNKFEDPNTRLVDILVAANYQCPSNVSIETTDNHVAISHVGHGYVFKKATASADSDSTLVPSLENTPARTWSDSVFRFSESATGDLATHLTNWTSKSGGYTVGSFDHDVPEKRSKTPFIGYPVIASYKLTAQASDCSRFYKNPITGELSGVPYQLYFVYGRPAQ